MTKIILHGVPCGCDPVNQLHIERSEVYSDTAEGEWYWLCMSEDTPQTFAFRATKEALLEFAYTIIDEFEEDDVEEAPKSYVEVVE